MERRWLLYDAPVPGCELNDFSYADDPFGARCPFHAHARKMNPRGEHEGKREDRRSIARRGIAFWKGELPPESRIPQGVTKGRSGLLFMCYQASIAEQFEFLQKIWANDDTFQYGQFPGVDSVIGVKTSTDFDDPKGAYYVEQKRVQRWPRRWGDTSSARLEANSRKFVNFLGGEYYFAPSLTWLRSLK